MRKHKKRWTLTSPQHTRRSKMKKIFKVVYQTVEGEQERESVLVTIKQAVELQLYCERNKYHMVKIVKCKS